jgi:cytochrome c oxidase subunit 1
MIMFAMPAIMLSSGFLLLDRTVGTHFFNPAEGGDPLLWQHLFWFFGHPEVYIIFIPGTGFVSTLVTVCSRRPLFGYTAVVLSLISTAFIGFGLWVHHIFATGLPQLGSTFFTAATMIIAIPTGIQFFCWGATLWSAGKIRMDTSIHFLFGFFFIFLVGGLTGVMLASVPLNIQVHDTFFVVAHLHYVLIGGMVFPLMGAFYHWIPKMTGRMLSEFAGRINFWLLFIGFNLTFFPMHILGMRGMPRRIYTYPLEMHWGRVNALESVGAMLMGAAVIAFVWNVWVSRASGRLAGDNPWGAGTLEWATTSPPPNYNFLDLPTVGGREPLWEDPPDQPFVTGVREDRREVLITKPLDAEPEHLTEFPYPTIWPFLAALAVTALFIGSIFTPWAVVWGAIPVAITLTAWFWPKRGESERRRQVEVWENR